MLAGSAPECRAELQGTANDPTASFENRLTAARVLVEHKMPDAARLLDAVINQGIQNGPAVTAEALARMPPSVSNEPLKRLLSSENADAQYLAARALAPRRVKDAMAPLRSVATDPEAGAARSGSALTSQQTTLTLPTVTVTPSGASAAATGAASSAGTATAACVTTGVCAQTAAVNNTATSTETAVLINSRAGPRGRS